MYPSGYVSTGYGVIIGAGVAGDSAAFHLSKVGVSNVVVIDEASQPGKGLPFKRSGSAVMDVAPVIKMMVQIFASRSERFISHHGKEGASHY
eukprot:10628350-Ditylum_brightwellii.AAC.2